MGATLRRKIQDKTANVMVVGLGYVGLPLAVNFAKAGFPVVGLDKDEDRVRRVNQKESYISDIPTKELAAVVSKKRLIARTDFTLLSQAEVIIICVPTPLKRKYTPDITYILGAVRTISRYLTKNTLIILESTTYPGTTEELILPELKKSGLVLGKDFYLCFSPERIDPGNPQYDVTRIPKVVGGMTPDSGRLAKQLYESIIERVHLVSSPKVAEMTKLLENSFRIINIGWINEIAMMSHQMGIDVWEVIEAAKTKPFGFMPFYPGLGVGGHCIPDDPLYLYWKARHAGFHSKFIKLSADINAGMPAYVVGRLREILPKSLNRARILVLGVTYKKDVKDLRKSPSLKLIELLRRERATVDYHDPIIPYLDIKPLRMDSVSLDKKTIEGYDCVVVATDHTAVDYARVRRHAARIFDTRHVYAGVKDSKIIRL